MERRLKVKNKNLILFVLMLSSSSLKSKAIICHSFVLKSRINIHCINEDITKNNLIGPNQEFSHIKLGYQQINYYQSVSGKKEKFNNCSLLALSDSEISTFNMKNINMNKNMKRNYGGNLKGKENKIIGVGLLLMAVLSGISFSALGTLVASLGLVSIFVLDILVSFGIYRYYKNENPKLSKTSSILRLLYTAIFGVGIGYHIMGNVAVFNKIFEVGLISFGAHLITLGSLFSKKGDKKWVNKLIKFLLVAGGIGYIIINIGKILFSKPALITMLIEPVFMMPMIFGEVFFALWMLIKASKSKS